MDQLMARSCHEAVAPELGAALRGEYDILVGLSSHGASTPAFQDATGSPTIKRSSPSGLVVRESRAPMG